MPVSSRSGAAIERCAACAACANAAISELESATVDQLLSDDARELKTALLAIESSRAEASLRHSIAGRIGTGLESISRMAGFDWRTTIALVGGFAAKEVIVSTLGTAYSLGEVGAEAANSLSDRLAAEPGWRSLTAWSLLIFVMFYAPCFVTVVCIAKESNWKWGVFSMIFNTGLAFSLAVLVYQTGLLLGY